MFQMGLRSISAGIHIGLMAFFGIEMITGVPFFERFILIFVPKKRHPNKPYVTQVPMSRMHLYTIIQAFLVAAVIASEYIPFFGPLFGFLTALTAFIPPFVLAKLCYTKNQLKALSEGWNVRTHTRGELFVIHCFLKVIFQCNEVINELTSVFGCHNYV